MSGVICLTFSGMIVTYASVQNKNLATIVNGRGEVSENDTSSNGDVKMLYGFFRNQNCSDIQFLKLNN